METFDPRMDTFENRMIVVKSLVGSHNYNLNTVNSDLDYKMFVCPSFDDLYNNVRFSTGKQSETVDYTVHDIRSLPELLWKANVNFIEVLFSTDLYFHAGLSWMFNNAENLAFMNLPAFYKASMGMYYEKMSNMHKGTATTEKLVKQFGYDTKQACHALRLLYTVERVSSGMTMQQSLWFSKNDYHRTILLAVKNGKISEKQFNRITAIWHKNNRSRAEDWFSGKVENRELKTKAEEIVKEFIKTGIQFL